MASRTNKQLNQNTKSIPHKPVPKETINELKQLLAEKERKIKQCSTTINKLVTKQHVLFTKDVRLRRAQNERKSLLVDGYIRRIAMSLSSSPIIPVEIGDICFGFYFYFYQSAADALAALLGVSRKKFRKKLTFEKYDTMLRLGMSIHCTINRMTSDGVDKKARIQYRNRYHAKTGYDAPEDPVDFGLKPKKDVILGNVIKMRRLTWNPVPLSRINNSIWEHMDETCIKYDHTHFELHFQIRKMPQITAALYGQSCIYNSNFESETKENCKSYFVSKKRTKEVRNGLKQLNLSIKQIRDVLHAMDARIMTTNKLEILLSIIPTVHEQLQAQKWMIGPLNDYAIVERFFFALCDFADLKQRLKLWMFKQNFKEIRNAILDQYKFIGKASDKIRNNRNLKLLLAIILLFGNHMNSGTRKGCAYGFDLSLLIKLKDIQSPLNKQESLLMYVYRFCDQRYPNALKVMDELYVYVHNAMMVDRQGLQQLYDTFYQYMQQIKDLTSLNDETMYSSDDRFLSVMKQFYKTAWNWARKLNMTVGGVIVSNKRVMKKYAFVGTSEQFFKIWNEFLDDFKLAKYKLVDLEQEKYRNDPDYKTILHKSSGIYKALEKRWKFKQTETYTFLKQHIKQRFTE